MDPNRLVINFLLVCCDKFQFSDDLFCLQEKDLGDDASLRSIDIKEELRKMTLDMVKVTGLLGAVTR